MTGTMIGLPELHSQPTNPPS